MPRPTHFEIPADNPERAMAFYRDVLGWTFQKWEGPTDYWLIMTGADGEPGINGGLLRRQHPEQPCVNSMYVADLNATLAAVDSHGGSCAVPRMPIPGVGWLAYCKDTEGHLFGLMQPDPAAK
jgi:predicted enzyme related to lactoylglutathione lyase